MESKDGSRLGDEFQDGTGLELSLGLSLSSMDARQKWKAAEAASAPSSSSIDPAGESSTGTNINGLHALAKQKASGKPSGINTAIKKFLEWGLDYQDENSALLDGSNGFGLDKEKERLLLADTHERSSQRLDASAPEAEGKGNPFLFKELQGSSVRASSRSQSPGQTTPLQLVDAFKDTPTPGSPGSAQGHCEFDEDDKNHEDSGPHKMFQDHQRKRKHLMDDHTLQKKGKSEETLHGFCGLGSHPILTASNVDVDRSPQALRRDNSRGQIQDVTGKEEKDSAEAEKGQETNQDESPHCEKNIIGNLGQNEYGRTSNEVKGAGENVMSQYKAPDTSIQKISVQNEDESTWHRFVPVSTEPMNVLDRENSVNKASAGSSLLKDRQFLVAGRNGDKASSPLHRKRDKVSSETSSVSTGGTEKVDEKTRSGEASSSVPEVASYKDPSSTSIVTPPFCSPVTAISSAQVPYPVSPYPLVPPPYPVSVSMPHPHGMLFPTGMNFPYSMQFVPPGSEGSQQNLRPVGTNAFQHPGIEYPQLSPSEVASRMLPMRPPVLSPFTYASNGALHNRNTMGVPSEDANAKLPALARMHDNEAGNLPPVADPSLVQNDALFRASVQSGVHDQLAHMPALTAPAIPTVHHVPLHLGVSDHGDILSLKHQNSTDSLRSFASSAQNFQMHPPPGIGRPPTCIGNRENTGGGGKSSSLAIQQHMQARNTTEPNSVGQEEGVRAVGSDFHHGSTENLLDGLGEDTAFLQFGIAPGFKFGGTGTAPNLPWVHVTGPNGQTINGVLYRVQRTQLKGVVCACHGKHMSPMEFAQHAGIVDVGSGDKNGGVNASPTHRPN